MNFDLEGIVVQIDKTKFLIECFNEILIDYYRVILFYKK